MRLIPLHTLSISFFFCLTMSIHPVTAQTNSDAFGDSIPISNGLLGRIYLLPDTTTHLPDFDTLSALSEPIYAKGIDVSERSWSTGFPGLRNRFEYFGIEYTTSFQVLLPGWYHFHLISDDGSKMWIDDTLRIDYDGVHAAGMREDSILLGPGAHSFKLDYFQGPRYQLALQLTYNPDTAKEQIFPGKMFILHTPKPFNWWPWLIVLIVLLAIGFYFLRKAIKKEDWSSAVVPTGD